MGLGRGLVNNFIIKCYFIRNILGDPGFPLNSIYSKPSSAEESDLIRQYFLQLRHETGEKERFQQLYKSKF